MPKGIKGFQKGYIPYNKGKKLPLEVGRNISLGMKKSNKKIGRPKGLPAYNKGKPHSIKHKLNLRKAWNYEKHFTDATREKIRRATFRYVKEVRCENKIMYPCIGKYEKPILDTFEKFFGYTISRQYPVAGYFVDGYCHTLHLAIEVDESFHRNMKEADNYRENIIKKQLNCSFLRIKVPEERN